MIDEKTKGWRPRLFKAGDKGAYLHEMLKSPMVRACIPERPFPEYAMSALTVASHRIKCGRIPTSEGSWNGVP